MSTRRRILFACGALALAAHVALVLRVFPPALFVQNEIPLAGDVPRYFATVAGAAEAGGLYGYDPFNMAGYPVGLWNSMGKKGFEIAHLLLPDLGLPRLFYLVLVGVALVSPLVFWLALRPLCPTPRSRRVLLVLMLVFWHLAADISYFWTFGNVFFPAAGCLVAMLVPLLEGTLRGRRPWLAALGLGVLAAAVFYAHTVALLAGILPLLFLFACRIRGGLPAGRYVALALSIAVFALLALPWALPLLQNIDDSVPAPKAWFQGGTKYLAMDLLSDRVYRHPFDRNALFHAAVVTGLAGTLMLVRRRQAAPVVALGIGALGALAITYIGPYVRAFQAVQPYRFTIIATLLLLAPAAAAIDAGLTAIRRSAPAARWTALAMLLIMLPAFTAYLVDLARPSDDKLLQEGDRALLDHVRGLQVRGRVLTDSATVGHLLPYFNRVSVLGGLSTQAFLKHRFAGIDEDGIGFGRPARTWTAATLKPYLEAYGVEYAIFDMSPWLSVARRAPGLFRLEAEVAGWSVFRIAGGVDHGLVLEGAADVSADGRGITVSNITVAPLVLKFHHAPWLTAGDAAQLEPVAVLDDPVPFIRAIPAPGVNAFVIRKP